MNKIAVPIVFFLLITNYLRGQESGNSQYNAYRPYIENKSNRTIDFVPQPAESGFTILIKGLYNLPADSYLAVFNLTQTAGTASETNTLANNRISLFKNKLFELGLDTGSIKTDIISFVPKYALDVENKVIGKNYNEIPVGFELQKNISVLYRRSGQIDAISMAAAESEIYDLVKVDYFSEGFEKAFKELREKCIAEVAVREKEYKSLGVRLDTLQKTFADGFATVYPPDRYYSYEASLRPEMPEKRKFSNYNESPKSYSKYYMPVGREGFDLVINPIVSEPIIQIAYSLAVLYSVPKIKSSKPEYYIVSPTGDLKKVEMH